MTREADPELILLLRNIDHAYEKQAWHGPNLRGSIRGLDAAQASWRPGVKRHSIADIVVHCAYWKYAVRRRLRGDKRGSFAVKGSNWFVLPDRLTESSWKSYVALLDAEHRAMRETIAQLPASKLHTKSAGSRFTNATLISGIAAHDVYHAGQIQILKRLQAKG
jgi:uncharacterized damage-inducible protein DinB